MKVCWSKIMKNCDEIFALSDSVVFTEWSCIYIIQTFDTNCVVLWWENLLKLLSLRETLMETLCSILSGNASASLPAAVCIAKLRCARYESDTVWWCQFMLAAEKST